MSDPRGRRVAVVPDGLLDSALPALEREGYGVIQLPPEDIDGETAAAWLEQVAEHVAEFRRNDYEVVLVDGSEHGEALAAALAELEVGPLPQYAIQPPSTSRLTPET